MVLLNPQARKNVLKIHKTTATGVDKRGFVDFENKNGVSEREEF